MKVVFIESGFLICEKEMSYIPINEDRIWIDNNLYFIDDRIFMLDPKPYVKVFITRISE